MRGSHWQAAKVRQIPVSLKNAADTNLKYKPKSSVGNSCCVICACDDIKGIEIRPEFVIQSFHYIQTTIQGLLLALR
jgi:hypothetical protein